MATAAAAAVALGWTRWFHCESSMDLSLVQESPGLFAVAQEGESGIQLAILKIEATDDLFYTLNHLVCTGSPLHDKFEKRSCLLRYAIVPDNASREVALRELQAWLAEPGEARSPFVKDFLWIRESHPFRGPSD
ncbi:MAG: hypothetical protein ABSD20_10605 [Terriglobales bacterium]